MELGKGYIKGPTGSVTFKDSNIPIAMDKKTGNLVASNIEVVGGSITFNDATHYTLGPNTQISTYGLTASVRDSTEFYLQKGKCSDALNCIEADSLLKNLRVSSIKGNQIAISADDQVYENFDMRKDKSSGFILAFDDIREVKFESGDDTRPLAKGNLNDIKGKIIAGIIGGDAWVYDADKKEFKKCDDCASVGKVYGNSVGRSGKYRIFIDKDGTIHILDLKKGVPERFKEIFEDLDKIEVPTDLDAEVRQIPGGALVKPQGGSPFIISQGSFDATNYRGIPIQLDSAQGPATLRVGGKEFLFDDLPNVFVDEKGHIQIKSGNLFLGEANPVSRIKGPDGITLVPPDEAGDKANDYIKAKPAEIEINSVAGIGSFYAELNSPEGSKGQLRILKDSKTNNLVKITSDATEGIRVTIQTDSNLNTPEEFIPIFEIQNGQQLLRISPQRALVEEVSAPTHDLTRKPTTYSPLKIQLELLDPFGNRVKYQIDPSVGYKRFDTIQPIK
jgi:hypothetical protein